MIGRAGGFRSNEVASEDGLDPMLRVVCVCVVALKVDCDSHKSLDPHFLSMLLTRQVVSHQFSPTNCRAMLRAMLLTVCFTPLAHSLIASTSLTTLNLNVRLYGNPRHTGNHCQRPQTPL
jgi:hypothetical protein